MVMGRCSRENGSFRKLRVFHDQRNAFYPGVEYLEDSVLECGFMPKLPHFLPPQRYCHNLSGKSRVSVKKGNSSIEICSFICKLVENERSRVALTRGLHCGPLRAFRQWFVISIC
jgi:hypothetical protein